MQTMMGLTTKKWHDHYSVRITDYPTLGYEVFKRKDGWHVVSECTGEPAFYVSVFPTKRQAYNAIIDHNN